MYCSPYTKIVRHILPAFMVFPSLLVVVLVSVLMLFSLLLMNKVYVNLVASTNFHLSIELVIVRFCIQILFSLNKAGCTATQVTIRRGNNRIDYSSIWAWAVVHKPYKKEQLKMLWRDIRTDRLTDKENQRVV